MKSLIQPLSEEVAGIKPPTGAMLRDGPGMSYVFERSQDFCVVECSFKMLTMLMTRNPMPIDGSMTSVLLSGRDFNPKRLGVIVHYLDEVEEEPIIHFLTDVHLGEESDRFLFHIGSIHDVRVAIYDTSEVSYPSVVPPGKIASFWIEDKNR